METKFLLEIVFADGESARQHYDTAAQPARVMDAVADVRNLKSLTLRTVKVVTLREMASS